MELRRSTEKVREAYHRHSQELKETMATINTLADGPTRRTLKAKAYSLPSLSFRSKVLHLGVASPIAIKSTGSPFWTTMPWPAGSASVQVQACMRAESTLTV